MSANAWMVGHGPVAPTASVALVASAPWRASGRTAAPAAGVREQALAALADGIRACIHCRPDAELGVLG
ncbi:DUF6233 domain-containing protein [Streptomyces sp. NBC_01653]|uniref:DUF6233 domain-containing protein n=2 Tax=unclassified Streptomyces TaxID=2593676 RepID=UPI00386425C4